MSVSPRMGARLSLLRSTTASALVFGVFLATGAVYIIVAKSLGVSPLWTTTGPLVIIAIYATMLGFARHLGLRDDQAGDNLYYLGFLFTLTSLGVSLWQFSTLGGAETIVTNFGIAVSSTILGVALRVIFGQMRQDPLEVERTARLELAEAARRVRQELDAAVLELSSFRRATQQSLAEGITEVREQIRIASASVLEAFTQLPDQSAATLIGVSKQTSDALEALSMTLLAGLEESGAALEQGTVSLGGAAREITEVLKELEGQLKAMQMPNGIIEVKLAPTVRVITKALRDFSEQFGAQVDGLQSAVIAATAATQEAKEDAEAASSVQNRHLERIAALLSLSEASLRQMSNRLSPAQDRPREPELDGIGKPPGRLSDRARAQPAPTDLERPRNIGAAAPQGSGLSRLWRPKR
jgi:hypothetical protein